MKISPLLLGLLAVASPLMAQEDESRLKSTAREISNEFPSTRFINVEFNQSLSRDFESQLFDRDFQNGRIESPKSVDVSANLPFYVYKKKWIFSTSLNYRYNEFDFGGVENVSSFNDYEQSGTSTFHNFSVALNTTYISAWGDKTLIYNGSIISDGALNSGFERIKALFGASLVLKKTPLTTMTVGVFAFIDPTSQIPFAPTFSYNRKWQNSPWEFDFILPQRVLLRRPIFKHSRLSIGTELGGNGFYVNVNQPNFPSTFQYNQLEIKTGIIYEHKISNSVIATFRGGLTNFVSNRLTEKGERNRDYIYKNTQNATGYFNAGISYNPFANRMKKKAE